jgi:RNA-directed DNA polymerase
VIGVIGTKTDAESIMRQMEKFLMDELHLETAPDKSRITHATDGTIFLGYEVITITTDKIVNVKRGKIHTPCRTVAQRLRLRIPEDKLVRFCREKGYGNYVAFNGQHKAGIARRTDTEIIMAYNAELRGFANYYGLAYGVRSRLHRLYYVWRMSLFKTLALKHKTTTAKIARRLHQGQDYIHWYEVQGRKHRLKLFKLADIKYPSDTEPRLDNKPGPWLTVGRTEVVQRLNATTCEYCGRNTGYFEVHHVRKLSDVADGKQLWQKVMSAMQRKTIVLCHECHDLLHHGQLPDWRWRKYEEAESRMNRKVQVRFGGGVTFLP